MSRAEALEAVRTAAHEAAKAGELPSFLAALEQVRAEALLAAAVPSASTPARTLPGRILTVQEAAVRLGRSRWWIYRHKATLPVTRLQSGSYGFDSKALERWIDGRTR